MSDNGAQAALAAAAARIAELEQQLAQAATALTSTQSALDTSRSDAQSAHAHVSTLTTSLANSESQRQALAGQLAEINAPAEPGIRRGPPAFITDDGKQFASLNDARMHVLAYTLGVDANVASKLVARQSVITPLLQKLAPTT